MTVAPVTAAIDVTRTGGLDDLGLWHDSYGRFAPRGFTAAKFAALALIRGEAAAQQARSHPDGIDLRLRPGSEPFDALGVGPHRAVHYDDARALVSVPGGRRVIIPWDLFEEPDAPPPLPKPQPRVHLGDLSYVTDTTIPWADRVSRLRGDRERIADALGPPDTWFRYAAHDTLTRLWADPTGATLTPHERRSLEAVEAIEEVGKAIAALVAERADGADDNQSTYDPDKMLAALDRFLPGASQGIDGWEGADDTTRQAWADLLDGIRNGTTELLIKPNGISMFLIRDGHPSIRAVLESKNHPGDYSTPGQWVTTDSGRRRWQAEKLGHIEVEVQTGKSRWAWPTAWARGTGEFAAAKAEIKATTDAGKKDNFEALSNPPTVRAWIETMEALGVDMSTGPDVRVGTGPVPTIDKTIMVDGTPIQRTVRDYDALIGQEWDTVGKLKKGSTPAKTITAAFAPYPRTWTETLPPQHFDIANTKSAKVGNAHNSYRDGVNVLRVPSLAANPQHTGSVVHEVGHSMQDSVPGLHLGEMWHMISRMKSHPGEQHIDVSGGRGVGFRDDFTDDYSGRFYPGMNPNIPDEERGQFRIIVNGDDPYREKDGEMLPIVEAFELFTTGIQSLYGKRKRTIDGDERLVGFSLGMMALNQPQAPAAPMSNDRPERPGASVDGFDVGGTSVKLDKLATPPAPGRAAIPAGAKRLYHVTSGAESLQSILDRGLLTEYEGSAGGYGRNPDHPGRVWATTEKPDGFNSYVEFWMNPDELEGDGDVTRIAGDVPPDRIVSYSTRTLASLRDYRRMFKNMPTDEVAARPSTGSDTQQAAWSAYLAERGVAAPASNDRAEAPRKGSAVAHAYIDRIEAVLGDPVPAEPGYEMQTSWYQRRENGVTVSDGVDGAYDLERFFEMHGRYSDTDDEGDRRFLEATQAGLVGLFEDMERAGIPSPRSPEVRAALRRVADALPDGVELQTGTRFYGDGPSNIGVPVEGIEGVADALHRFGPLTLGDLHLDTVKLTEQRPMFGSNGSAYMFPRADASSLVLASGMYGWPPSGKAKTPWGFEHYAATTHREYTEHLMVHEVGHLIHAETVRRSGVDLTPDDRNPAKFLNAMTDDAMARLERIAADHPDLFADARSVTSMEPTAHNVTHSAVTEYGAEEAAEYLAEAFALAVFGSNPNRPVWGKVVPSQQTARATMSDVAAHRLWADMYGGWPFPGALAFWPKDWPDSRRAAAVIAGGVPPGWGPDNVRALMDSAEVTDAQRVALQAILDSMGE